MVCFQGNKREKGIKSFFYPFLAYVNIINNNYTVYPASARQKQKQAL
jgi:hypothetical protein